MTNDQAPMTNDEVCRRIAKRRQGGMDDDLRLFAGFRGAMGENDRQLREATMNMLRCSAAVTLLFGLVVSARTDEPSDEYGFSTGKTMPVFVVDFVSGKHQGHCGCPAMMVSNARARGVIVLAREANDSIWTLAKALETTAVDGKKVHGHLVVLTAKEDSLTAATEKAGLAQFNVAAPRSVAKSHFNAMGLADQVLINVLLTDRREVKKSYLLTAEELTAEKQKEIVAAAEKFAQP
jgi:hypothetical protein